MPIIPSRKFTRRNKTDPWYKLLGGFLKNLPYRRRGFFHLFFQGFLERHRKNATGLRYQIFRQAAASFRFPELRRERATRLTRYRITLRSRISFKRFFYPLREKRLRRIVLSISSKVEDKKYTFYKFFESRLSVVIVRSRFFLSPLLVRQEITHGRVFVNGLPVFFPSYRLALGDIVTFPLSSGLRIKLHFAKFFRQVFFHGYFKKHLLTAPDHLCLSYSYPFIQFRGFSFKTTAFYPFSAKFIT